MPPCSDYSYKEGGVLYFVVAGLFDLESADDSNKIICQLT